MIYATEQQVVVTVVMVVTVALVALFTGILWGHRRGMAEAAEEERWAREQAEARRAHSVYRQERSPWQAAHEANPDWEDQALTLANETVVLEPTRLLTPADMSWTGEIQRMTAAFEEDMARIMSGTDEQLREITR